MVGAVAVGDRLVIEIGDRVTDIKVHDPGGDAPADGVAHIDVSSYGEFPAGKEAQVEEEDGELDAD